MDFMFYRNLSDYMLLKESELDTELIREAILVFCNCFDMYEASVFHYGSISLIVEPTRSTHFPAMMIARQGGALLSYDPNVRLPLWPYADEAHKGIISIWDKADLIKISDEEVAFLTGGNSDDDEVVMSLCHPKLKILFVTDGMKGYRYYTKSFRGRVNTISAKAIDTTGVGDAFVGGVLIRLQMACMCLRLNRG